MKKNNIFNTANGRAAIERLSQYPSTNIRYGYVHRYGEDKVREELADAAGRTVYMKVCYDSHEPDDIAIYKYEGDTPYRIRIPIMPTVLISLKPIA